MLVVAVPVVLISVEVVSTGVVVGAALGSVLDSAVEDNVVFVFSHAEFLNCMRRKRNCKPSIRLPQISLIFRGLGNSFP